MKKILLITGLSVFSTFVSRAELFTANGEVSDRSIGLNASNVPALISNASAPTLRAGDDNAAYNQGNGCGIVVFRLPALNGGTVSGANLGFTWRLGNENSVRLPVSLHLYGVRYSSSSAVVTGDYGYMAVTNATDVLIQSQIVTKSTVDAVALAPAETDVSGDAALAAWISAQYTAGAQPGDYVFLRLHATGPTANGWEIGSADNTDPLLRPVLSITTGGGGVAYVLTVNANPGGSVTGGGTFSENANPQITATASNGFTFLNWTGSVSSASSTTNVLMTANQTVWANFVSVTDQDGDGLPDEWETQYFGGPANADPSALAANGNNTIRDMYITGLNPTNPQSAFQLIHSQNLLQWSAVSGRVYSIYWTTNLLTGFQCLETNIAWPQTSWTGLMNQAQSGGFYQIRVQVGSAATNSPPPVSTGGTARITGNYMMDMDGNGINDGIDRSNGGYEIRLLDAAQQVIATATAGAGSGYYKFDTLPAGSYQVEFETPLPNYEFAQAHAAGSSSTTDSDVTVVLTNGNGRTDAVQLADGQTKDIDALVRNRQDGSFTNGNLRILFVGNSYSYDSQYYADLSKKSSSVGDSDSNPNRLKYGSNHQFVRLALAAGYNIEFYGSYIGGQCLIDQWNDTSYPMAREEISSGFYDLVVMQGGGKGTFGTYADLFSDLAHSNGMSVAFFSPWAADNEIDLVGGSAVIGGTFININNQHVSAATRNNGAYLPTYHAHYVAYERLAARYGLTGSQLEANEDLLTRDGIHPSSLLAYLAGNVFFRTLLKDVPPGPDVYLPPGVLYADAVLMQEVAAEAVAAHAIFLP